MKSGLSFLFFLAVSSSFGQYYFNDIVSTRQSNDQYKLLRTLHVKVIKATSYDADNSISEGFFLEEDISLDGKKITLSSSLTGGKTAVTNRYYEMGRLKRTQAFSNGIENKTEYTYSEKGQVQKILFITNDTAMKSSSTEVHEWVYDEAGQPVSMLRIKNRTDTTFILMVKDEQGQTGEEQWKRKNHTIETYYYYYDDKKQLTDIVRFNARLKKLLPDFQYEYDPNGRISRMTQVSMSSASYFIWKYDYNEKGLKIKETGLDKEKKLAGRIEYSYEF